MSKIAIGLILFILIVFLLISGLFGYILADNKIYNYADLDEPIISTNCKNYYVISKDKDKINEGN